MVHVYATVKHGPPLARGVQRWTIMTTTNLNILSLCILLAGCGGSAFDVAAATDGDAGPGGVGGAGSAPEADGGTPAPGAGGAGGRVGTVLGTGGVTLGTGGATTATGGVTAGTGGAEPGGAGGTTGTGGAGIGGTTAGAGGATVGAGGGAATCKPPVVDDTILPTSFVWDSYTSQVGTTCLTCAHSPCATCAVTWWPWSQSADGLTLTATASVTCGPVDASLGPCGSDPTASICTTWTAPGIPATTLVFSLRPKSDGSGYSAVYRTNTNTGVDSYQGFYGACQRDTYDAAEQASHPMWSLWFALRDSVVATEFPCGS